MVNGLEDRGLIRRRISPDHGRIQLTELTNTGLALLEACEEEVNRIEERVFGRLADNDESRLRELLQSSINYDSPG
jgi:DNA-binding MarR family transcriptional regulator